MSKVLQRLLLVMFSLFTAESALAAMYSKVALYGSVSDFDDHYVYIDAVTERYKVKRGDVPDKIDLRPGAKVSFEVPLDDLRILPATAPMIQRPYKAPRKRVPAEQ